MAINWWKKWTDFVKIKFYSNEYIKWHCMQLELNWFPIQLNLIEQLDYGSIEEKWDVHWRASIENTLMNMVLEKKKNYKKIGNYTFLCFFTWEWTKYISIWNHPNDNLWLMKLKVVLPKISSMNHY
jgi:hypothetical protein